MTYAQTSSAKFGEQYTCQMQDFIQYKNNLIMIIIEFMNIQLE